MNHYLTEKISYNGIEVINIFKRFKFIEQFSSSQKCYTEYIVRNGETPEIISFMAYGTTDWWWVVCLMNNIYNPFYDWPLSQTEIESYAKKLVPNWESNTADYSAKMDELTVANYKKSQIKLLKPYYFDEIIKEMSGFNR